MNNNNKHFMYIVIVITKKIKLVWNVNKSTWGNLIVHTMINNHSSITTCHKLYLVMANVRGDF